MAPGTARKTGLILLLLTVVIGLACPKSHAKDRPWFFPDHFKSQYAGNMGLVSVGLGYSHFDDKLHLDVFYGYVPTFVGGVETHTVTTKIAVFPINYIIKPGHKLSPLTFGWNLSVIIGEDYFFKPPDRYPENYYWATNFKIMPYIGARAHRDLSNRIPFSGLDFYVEIGTVDLYLHDFLHSKFVGIWDILNFSFGFGVNF